MEEIFIIANIEYMLIDHPRRKEKEKKDKDRDKGGDYLALELLGWLYQAARIRM